MLLYLFLNKFYWIKNLKWAIEFFSKKKYSLVYAYASLDNLWHALKDTKLCNIILWTYLILESVFFIILVL